MDIPAGAVDYDIVYVCSCVRLVRPKELVHHLLERGGCAIDAEWEVSIFTKPPWGRKRLLLPSGFGERNLPVPLSEVQDGEVAGGSEPLNQFIDIQSPEVVTKSKSPIGFGDQHDRARPVPCSNIHTSMSTLKCRTLSVLTVC